MINKTKRLDASRSLKLPRKKYFWAPTSLPGKHSRENSMPILIALRDYLKFGDKEREVSRILNSRSVLVDGKAVKKRRVGIGLMDVITITPLGFSYRVLLDERGKLILRKENEEAKKLKPLKVMNKVTIKGGKTQIVFHDGETLLSDDKNISTGDVVILSVPEKKIEHVLKMQTGSKAFLVGGNHVGKFVTIKSIEVKKSSSSNLIHFEENFSTTAENVFVVGNPKYSFPVTEGDVA